MKSNKLFGMIAAVGLLFTHFSCQQEQKIPRIGIAGIAIECSTFSPAVSDEASFRVRKGEDVLKGYPFLAADSTLGQKAEWLPAMVSGATPVSYTHLRAHET